MPTLIDTTLAALALLFSGDTELWQVVGVSFSVSGIALLLVLLPALLLGFALAYLPLPGRWLWLSCINTLQSVPTVVIGLLLYMLLSRAGPFGDWKLLFTQQAMVVGQMLIAFPVIATMAHAAFVQSDRRAWETALTLGVSWPKALIGLMHECRFGLLAAIIGAFSRIVTEVGCSMMVGGQHPALYPQHPDRHRAGDPERGLHSGGRPRHSAAHPRLAAQPAANGVSRPQLSEELTMPPLCINRSTPWP